MNKKAFFLILALLLCIVNVMPVFGARAVERISDTTSAKRLALVIGNSNYVKSPLKNPVNDAVDIALVLRKIGFQVILLKDSGQQEMEQAIRKFGKMLNPGSIGLFYFAGHGLQYNGRNYLIPVDAQIEDESDVKFEAVDAGRVLGKMEMAGNGLNIVILDACRNNPFTRSFRSSEQGLARMDAPTGSLVAYATSPGSVAADGTGRNGVYTKYLLKYINQPGLSINKFFMKVRRDVLRETGSKQTPWESSSLTGDFSFTGAIVSSPVIESKPTAYFDAEEEFWQAIKGSAEAIDFRDYLDAYPDGRFAAIARLKLRKINNFSPVRSYIDSNTGMKFVYIKGGCYRMGDTFGDGLNFEKPVHEVCVDSFWMGKYEVTQGEYARIVSSNPSNFKKGDNYPVEQVSWHDARSYINRLNSRSNKNYRLPSEAEWEYAARARGLNVRFGTGNNTIGPDEANFDGRVKYQKNYSRAGSYLKQTTVVGSFGPNSIGLYDMSGNVYEWCLDWFGENYYNSRSRNNPKGPTSGSFRIFRGGGWGSYPDAVRSTSRGKNVPGLRNSGLGFRLVFSE